MTGGGGTRSRRGIGVIWGSCVGWAEGGCTGNGSTGHIRRTLDNRDNNNNKDKDRDKEDKERLERKVMVFV